MASRSYSNSIYNNNTYFPGGSFVNRNPSVYSASDVNNNPPYIFKERNGKLKWKELMKLDLDQMIKENDISPLEPYLENLIFSSIDDNDLHLVPETSFLKLITINQYIMEFLLDTQQRLEYENKMIEANYNQLVTEAINREAILKDNKSLIGMLKKDKKEKEIMLNTYKCLIDEYKEGRFVDAKPAKKYFYCKICEGKKFSTEENLNSHMIRRHNLRNSSEESIAITKENIKEVSKEASGSKEVKIEENFENMKVFFETYIKNFQNESLNKIFENQKNLESKIHEIKSEKENDLKGIENQFKTTLVEIKELYSKNISIGNSYLPNDNIPKIEDEATKKLLNETNKMNEMLQLISREQNNKIEMLLEQFSQFKSNVEVEFKEIKCAHKEISIKENESQAVINNSIKAPESPKKDVLIRDSVARNSIVKTKKQFNSGPLESDDEFDNQNFLKNQSISNIQDKFSFGLDSKESFINLKTDDKKRSTLTESQDVVKIINENKRVFETISEVPTVKEVCESAGKYASPVKLPETSKEIEIISLDKVNLKPKEDIMIIEHSLEEERSKTNKEDIDKFYHSFVGRDNKALEKPKIENVTEMIL
jgi:hypothetical protein